MHNKSVHVPTSRPLPTGSARRSEAAAATGTVAGEFVSRSQLWRDYIELTKPEITLLVALSALGGYLLAPASDFDILRLVVLMVGVCLTSGGAAVLNHWIERHHDAAMRRTMNRPLAVGRVSAPAARNFGCVLIAAGVGLLCPLTNPLTGVLALISALLYLFVYTPLKRVTSWNTLIGTVPGAMPALGGWTAATGNLGWGGWAMFGILVAWQMPHFLSLAWMYKKDYVRGGYIMLPKVDPTGRSTVFQTLLFTVMLAVVSLWPVALGLTAWIYGVAAAAFGAWFVLEAARFFHSRAVRDARRVLKASVYYIPALVLALILDRIILGGLFAG